MSSWSGWSCQAQIEHLLGTGSDVHHICWKREAQPTRVLFCYLFFHHPLKYDMRFSGIEWVSQTKKKISGNIGHRRGQKTILWWTCNWHICSFDHRTTEAWSFISHCFPAIGSDQMRKNGHMRCTRRGWLFLQWNQKQGFAICNAIRMNIFLLVKQTDHIDKRVNSFRPAHQKGSFPC